MDKRRQFLILIALAIGVILLIAVIVIVVLNTNQPPKANGVGITNYDQKVKNISSTRKVNIEEALFNMIRFNTSDDYDITTIKDTVIRDGSDIQETEDNNKYSGSFIVDIPSIRQSYNIAYLYSVNNDGYDSGYPVVVSCLEESKVIYKDFECKERNSWQTSQDPLLQKLPYNGPYYSVSGYENAEEKVLVIKVMINTNSQRTIERFQTYKTEALQWITSQGVNPEDYTIEWRNLSNNPVSL